MTNQTIRLLASIMLLLPLAFSACVKDQCTEYYTYTYYVPTYRAKDEVRNNIKSNPAKSIEQPGKISILGKYIFLNDVDKGVHIIDNSNPAAPRNIAFIDIPGNLDIAIKGNTLYADMYTDVVAIDIANPASVSVKKFIDGVFPYRAYGNGFSNSNDPQKVIVNWVRHDTTIKNDCDNRMSFLDRSGGVFFAFSSASTAASSSAASPVGVGGSMARFTIMNDRLYTVSSSHLDVFNIADPSNPLHVKNINLGWNIETIYPFGDKLFIGSQTGMLMYNVSNPDQPVPAGTFEHARVCDPVIADDSYAYVTLRSGTTCQGFTNELNILQLNNNANPSLLKRYQLSNPHGLSKDGKYLFICDGKEGLKVYDASDKLNLAMVDNVPGLETYDVIAMNKIALVVAKDGLYQFSYANPANIVQLSRIGVNK